MKPVGQTTAKASKPAPKKAGRKVTHITVERAGNGYVMNTHREPPKMPGMGHFEGPETSVFPQGAKESKAIAQLFGDAEDAADAKDEKDAD